LALEALFERQQGGVNGVLERDVVVVAARQVFYGWARCVRLKRTASRGRSWR
jgi:hypothetical protein